jgi:hypothetical protein
MTYIDSAILNAIESACRKFQTLTGRTNVWVAGQLTNLSIIVYFVWAGLYFWNARVVPRVLVGIFCTVRLYALSQTIFKVPIEASETHAYRRVAKGVRNPRRVRDALLRISFLTLSVVLLYPLAVLSSIPFTSAQIRVRLPLILLTYSLIVLTTIVLYLLACDPLPPKPGKLREWLRGAVPARLSESESRK